MKHFGNTMVVWDLKTMQPQDLQCARRPARDPLGAAPDQNWAVTAAALTSKTG